MHRNDYFSLLEELTIPYWLEKYLSSKFKPTDLEDKKRLEFQIHSYNHKIKTFFDLPLIQHGIKKLKPKENRPSKASEVAKARDQTSDFKKMAYEASLYFQQGHELLKVALGTKEEASPLLEYYGFLQCVKGRILLDLELKLPVFFSYHGLIVSKRQSSHQSSQYIKAEVKPFGVFSALVLLTVDSSSFKDFLSKGYSLSLEEIISTKLEYNYFKMVSRTFIGSWMLSSLVRYDPKTWVKILMGKEDDIVASIRQFRRNNIPSALFDLLNLKKFPSLT